MGFVQVEILQDNENIISVPAKFLIACYSKLWSIPLYFLSIV